MAALESNSRARLGGVPPLSRSAGRIAALRPRMSRRPSTSIGPIRTASFPRPRQAIERSRHQLIGNNLATTIPVPGPGEAAAFVTDRPVEGCSLRWPSSGVRLIPNLDRVTVGVRREDVRSPGNELAGVDDLPAGAPDRLNGGVDVFRIPEAKTEVRHAFHFADMGLLPFENDHVMTARRLDLDHPRFAVYGLHAEDLLGESKALVRIANRQRNVRQPVRRNHVDTEARDRLLVT